MSHVKGEKYGRKRDAARLPGSSLEKTGDDLPLTSGGSYPHTVRIGLKKDASQDRLDGCGALWLTNQRQGACQLWLGATVLP